MLKASKNGKLRSVQREDVIYTEGICIKYQSRLNKGSTSLEWDSMRKGGGSVHILISCDATDHQTDEKSTQNNRGGTGL